MSIMTKYGGETVKQQYLTAMYDFLVGEISLGTLKMIKKNIIKKLYTNS